MRILALSALLAALPVCLAQTGAKTGTQTAPAGLNTIENIVVIYAENRSFDNLYGSFPGANGLANGKGKQVDRDGAPLKELPPIWGGLTAQSIVPPIAEAESAHLPNAPFGIDDPKGFNAPMTVITRDLWHLFYQNQMQIDGGRNDRFIAWADSGALPLGHYDGSRLVMWKIAKEYTLADNFFMGAFGSSFLNHFWLICACTPKYPDADKSPAKNLISIVEPDGVTLKLAANSPKSALDGPPKFAGNGNLTPDFYAVNTMQPPYQPSGNQSQSTATTLPPQTHKTIGDLLSAKGVSWAWYAGAWQAALSGDNKRPVPNFQPHHQPFNYFVSLAPGTPERDKHLKDGGLNGVEFIKAIDEGKLEQVSYYKPQGNLDEHSGYATVLAGDAHIADLIAHLKKSPQWKHMLVIVTYDENGGYWDHVSPPKGDRWGPGIRIPAIVISDYAKKNFVDHTQYDTTSIIRLISKRFDLPLLPGVRKNMGDLTGALDFTHR